LQQAKRFFRTSSPLVHNQGATKEGKNEFKSRHPHRIQAAPDPNKPGDVNKLFKHADECEIILQSIEIQRIKKQSSDSIQRFQQNL
jgi:hypothetical protein